MVDLSEDALPCDFGKYRLVKRIATGGMAEIFLAHRHDEPLQPLVIKRILSHLGKSNEFVSMFLDEARIAAQLEHENIVGIDDVGQIDGAYYIAMEYVHGEDIRRIYNRAYKLQRSLPLSHSIRVIADAALGLGYAHKLSDLAGRPMGVVHRDVSPQNILVTYEGKVKVVDFGIAKAANKVAQTRAGVLKGKYSYMSPEQALGDPIDHRTDIFALGIILYETTTGTRLFKRHNELATLQAIIKCEFVMPSEALPGYPPGLEEALVQALAKNPRDRYDDAEHFSETLYGFLHDSGLFVERDVISTFMHDLFKERLEEEETTGQPALPNEGEVREEMPGAATGVRAEETAAEPGRGVETVSDQAGFSNPSAAFGDPGSVGAIEATHADSSSAVVGEPHVSDTLQRPPESTKVSRPRSDEQPAPDMAPTEHAQPIYREATEDQAEDEPVARITVPPIEPAPITIPPSESDARAREESIPKTLPPSSNHGLDLAKTVPPLESQQVIPQSEEDKEGSLDRAQTVTPAEAMVRGPIPDPDPVPPEQSSGPDGRQKEETYRVRARRHLAEATEGEIESSAPRRIHPLVMATAAIFVAILAGIIAATVMGRMRAPKKVPPPPPPPVLTQPVASLGKVTFLTEPNSVVYAGDSQLGSASASGVGGPFEVEAGEHVFRVSNQALAFERTRKVSVEPGQSYQIEIKGHKGFLRIAVAPWARVTIDGKDLGITPLPLVPLYEGAHEVTLENPDIAKRVTKKIRIHAGSEVTLKLDLRSEGERM